MSSTPSLASVSAGACVTGTVLGRVGRRGLVAVRGGGVLDACRRRCRPGSACRCRCRPSARPARASQAGRGRTRASRAGGRSIVTGRASTLPTLVAVIVYLTRSPTSARSLGAMTVMSSVPSLASVSAGSLGERDLVRRLGRRCLVAVDRGRVLDAARVEVRLRDRVAPGADELLRRARASPAGPGCSPASRASGRRSSRRSASCCPRWSPSACSRSCRRRRHASSGGDDGHVDACPA